MPAPSEKGSVKASLGGCVVFGLNQRIDSQELKLLQIEEHAKIA